MYKRQHYFWIISAKSKVRLILYAFTSCIRRVLFFAGSFCGAGNNNTHSYTHKQRHTRVWVPCYIYKYIYILLIYTQRHVLGNTAEPESAALRLCWPKVDQMTAVLTRCPACMHAHTQARIHCHPLNCTHTHFYCVTETSTNTNGRTRCPCPLPCPAHTHTCTWTGYIASYS